MTDYIDTNPPPGMVNPMTTQDDIIVGGVSGVPTRLPRGQAGLFLGYDLTDNHLNAQRLGIDDAGGSIFCIRGSEAAPTISGKHANITATPTFVDYGPNFWIVSFRVNTTIIGFANLFTVNFPSISVSNEGFSCVQCYTLNAQNGSLIVSGLISNSLTVQVCQTINASGSNDVIGLFMFYRR